MPRCKKLSIVTSGRNDNYAGDFNERVFAAVARNQRESAAVGLNVEWIFVEWNPLNEDYLSYQLVQKGFKCYVVSPAIHKELIDSRLTFSQTFAKNVGIRRATGDWILVMNPDAVLDDDVWKFIANQDLQPEVMYRAERSDVHWSFFDQGFDVMAAHRTQWHDANGGRHFTQGAGDFIMMAAEKRLPFDEGVNYTDIHTDGRLCMNWSTIRSGGNTDSLAHFRFIGRVFKADHPLTYARTRESPGPNLKGPQDWPAYTRTGPGPALYEPVPNWGLRGRRERQIHERMWYID